VVTKCKFLNQGSELLKLFLVSDRNVSPDKLTVWPQWLTEIIRFCESKFISIKRKYSLIINK